MSIRIGAGLLAMLLLTATTQTRRSEAAEPSVAVVELFTSQGCSSCPPADAVLRQLASQEAESGTIYVLSFHVDYWNRLGWMDPYSTPAASDRQRAYAAAFQTSRVYTPQMIVGGVDQFVGSNSMLARKAISKALQRQPSSSVQLSTRLSKQSLTVRYRVSGNQTGDVLNLALVQNAEPIAVTRGENSGRRLGHANVVRYFEVVKLTDSGTGGGAAGTAIGEATMQLPRGFEAEDSALIAYVQNSETFEITGASVDNLRSAP